MATSHSTSTTPEARTASPDQPDRAPSAIHGRSAHDPTQGRARTLLDPYPPHLLDRPVGQGRRGEESADNHPIPTPTLAALPVVEVEGRIVRRPLTHARPVQQPTDRPAVRKPWPALALYGTGQILLTAVSLSGYADDAVTLQAFAAWAVCGAALIAANDLHNRTEARR